MSARKTLTTGSPIWCGDAATHGHACLHTPLHSTWSSRACNCAPFRARSLRVLDVCSRTKPKFWRQLQWVDWLQTGVPQPSRLRIAGPVQALLPSPPSQSSWTLGATSMDNELTPPIPCFLFVQMLGDRSDAISL